MKLKHLVQISDISGINGDTGLPGLFQFSCEALINRPVLTRPSPGRYVWAYREALHNGMRIHLYNILRILPVLNPSVPRDKVFCLLELTTSAVTLKPDRQHQTNIRHPIRGC